MLILLFLVGFIGFLIGVMSVHMFPGKSTPTDPIIKEMRSKELRDYFFNPIVQEMRKNKP